jgi:hypothetical protein
MKRWRAIVLFGIALAPSILLAQSSAYVPLDDVSYRYIDALMARGWLRELSSLERPYGERAITAAIDSARTRSPSEVINSYLDAVYGATEKYSARPGSTDSVADNEFRARFTNNFYLTGQSSGRRELMLSDGVMTARPGAAIRMVMSAGPVTGFSRVLIDNRLNTDPEFAGRKDRKIGARTEDGYARAQWKYGELTFGRLGRNWGPPLLYGLEVGNYAYTYDHLYARIGTDNLHWSTVVARLDNLVPAAGAEIQRYFSIHRVAGRFRSLEVALSESYVYSGESRGFEPSLANPFNIYALSWRNEREDGNLGLGGEAAFRTENRGTYATQFFLDDYQVDKSCNPNCKQPASYAALFSAEGLPLTRDQRWFASYARVANLTYRNKNPGQNYEVFGVGLGQGFSDYDELRAGLDLAVVPKTPLRLYGAFRRQGEGSYNSPFPLPADYASTPTIFSGVVMHVSRLGLSGGTHWNNLELDGDVGVNHATNYGHVAGRTRTSPEGRVKITIEPRWSMSF